MKPITTSVYTFREFITAGSLYVDKTALFHRLLDRASGKHYFLARPRRFGKSLTLSTLGEILAGNRPLFKGLAIDKLAYEWKPYPVVHIDLGDKQGTNAEELKLALSVELRSCARKQGIQLPELPPHLQFAELLELVAQKTGSQVVVLIDEYDKPILGNATNREELPKILQVLKAFYSVIKSADEYLRFAFLTGVSKFSRVSIFSDLNNLTDLTMKSAFATLCGYTQAELESNFDEHITALARQQGATREQTLEKIRYWYNGYRFSEAPIAVYNPVSIGKLFTDLQFDNYWFETGTPTMLVNLMKENQFNIEQQKQQWVAAEVFSAYEVEKIQPLPLCFQTGYLTIADVDRGGELPSYRLDYPNREVELSMTRVLLASELTLTDGETSGACHAVLRGFRAGGLDAVMTGLRTLFAGIPYSIQANDERYYQSLFVMVFKLIGFEIAAEVQTSGGRIDAVVKSKDTIYVLEFKLNGTADEALAQIREKRYCEPYLNDGRKVVAVGVEFAYEPEFRNIKAWKAEPY